jgi:hypothetical protein
VKKAMLWDFLEMGSICASLSYEKLFEFNQSLKDSLLQAQLNLALEKNQEN